MQFLFMNNCYLTWLLTVFCRRVFIRSSGWNKIVEKVPENDPARNDFNIGYCNMLINI